MSDNLIRNRQLCLDHAEGFIVAAERLGVNNFPHIVYHLSLLALEEIGKSNMIAGKLATGDAIESRWLEKGLENHQRKLQWAIWSPIDRLDPRDFEHAREFAERAHAMRLASLYVDAKAELTDLPACDVVGPKDAEHALALARARLGYERAGGTPDPAARETDENLRWFLDTIADPERSPRLFNKRFIAQYHAQGNDARAWITWARSEISRQDGEDQALLQSELARPAAAADQAQRKWRVNTTVHTPSHAIRPKALQRWNAQIEPVQLLWTGKKDRFTLQLTLHDNAPLSSLGPRAVHLAKLVVACLNIGTIGYFWFERAGFERQLFDEIRDLENNRRLEMGGGQSFWDDKRAIALSEEHIDRALHCMMAFGSLSEEDAAPIFRPYYDGLALMAKSDAFYNFDSLARGAFVSSLAGALAKYGGWDGSETSLRDCFDEAFAPIMPDLMHRDQMYSVLTPSGDEKETSLVNLRSAKQLADLYLTLVSRTTWRSMLDKGPDIEPS